MRVREHLCTSEDEGQNEALAEIEKTVDDMKEALSTSSAAARSQIQP